MRLPCSDATMKPLVISSFRPELFTPSAGPYMAAATIEGETRAADLRNDDECHAQEDHASL